MGKLVDIDQTIFGPWAIVTGASSGIGEEFARQLAANGLNIVLIARREHLLNQLGENLAQQYGVDYRVIGLDLSSENFLEEIIDRTQDLDVGLVVSVAGTPLHGDFLGMELGQLLQGVDLKVVAHLSIAHYFGNRLAERGYGGLLLVSSIGGLQGVPHVASTSAAEAYVLSLGEALHVEFKKRGVNVTVLLPGPTDTPGITKLGASADNMPIKPMSTEQCVSEGLMALRANRATHIAGRMNRIMARAMSRSVGTKVMGSMMSRIFAEG